MLNRKRIDLILRREVIEAMGCTEPAAAALAGAKAAELFGMEPERGEASVSPNMIPPPKDCLKLARRGERHDALPVFSRCAGFSYYCNQH